MESFFLNKLLSKLEAILGNKYSNSKKEMDRALDYAETLLNIYGGDIDVVIGLMAFNYFFGFHKENTKSEIDVYRGILVDINFLPEKTNKIIDLINFYKDNSPLMSIEGAIFLDVVQLVKFSEWRINLELVKYTDEKEIPPFSFLECKNFAQRERILNNFVTTLTAKKPEMPLHLKGKYIVLEGNSGVGKDTQAAILIKRIEDLGQKVLFVQEPSKAFRNLEKAWKENYDGQLIDEVSDFQKYLIIADRAKQMFDIIFPALKEGINVVSSRNFFSMLIYQCETEDERAFITWLHSIFPVPDVILIYDTNEEVCLKRVMERNPILTHFDKIEILKKSRPIYIDIIQYKSLGFNIALIDASEDIIKVSERTWEIIQPIVNTIQESNKDAAFIKVERY